MNKSSNNILLLSVVLILISFSLIYHLKNKKTYELNLPKLQEIETIALKEDTNGVVITSLDEIKEILEIFTNVSKITNKESIQDFPVNIDKKIQIDFYLDEENSLTVFLYQKNNKYYLEQPYNGIYDISIDLYNLIDNYV